MSAWTSRLWPGARLSSDFGSNTTFQPLGPLPESSTSSAGAGPGLVTSIGIEGSFPGAAASDGKLRLPRDVEHNLGVDVGVLGGRPHRHRILARLDRARRAHLEFDVLALPGVDRKSTRLNSSHIPLSRN